MDLNIMKALTGSTNCKLKNENELNGKSPSTFTATILDAKKIYCLFPGTVLFLGFYKEMGTITVRVSNHEIIRYLNMSDIQIWNQSTVDKGMYLGEAFSHSGLQFEYCTQWKGDSKFPVRIKNNLYYKQNPIDILNGKYVPQQEINIENGITRPNMKVTFTADQRREWEPKTINQIDHRIDPSQFRFTDTQEFPESVKAMLSDNF